MNKHLPLLLAAIAAIPCACTLAPKYVRPQAPVPAELPSSPGYLEVQRLTGAPQAQDLAWKDFFADEKLKQIIATALANNRDLRLATLNVEQARAMYGVQRNQLLPAVDAVGSGAKKRTPADLSSTGKALTSDSYSVNVGVVSWEVDLFGKLQSLKDAYLQQYLASEQARRGAQVSLVSGVASAYLTLAADREKLTLAQGTFEAQRDTYNLTKRRHELGLVQDLDLYRAEAQMDAARGDLARYQQAVAQDRNALNLLLGTPTSDDVLPAGLGAVAPTREIAAGLSSQVLLQRPDVLQAEASLRAANANMGAARAAFLPDISLTATLGTASAQLSNLFKGGQGTWAFSPQATMPIFDARTWSAHKVAKVQAETAVVQYEKAIQGAFREVADTLAVRGSIGEQLAAQQAMSDALGATFRLSTARYEKGLDSYLSVLDAQRTYYSAQQGLVSLRLAKYANDIRLYAVLGGGWQTESSAPDSAGAGQH